MNDLTVLGLEWLGALALFLGFIALVRYLDHRERMMLIERGLLDDLDAERLRATRSSAQLRGGLITAMVGLAVTVALYTLGYLLPPPLNAVPGRFGPWLLPGLIPLAIGLALVANYYLAPPRLQRRSDAAQTLDASKDPPARGERRSGWRVLDSQRPPETPETPDDVANV